MSQGSLSGWACNDAGRRRRLIEQEAPVGSRIDAIDFLVVADGEAVPEALKQRVLLVRMVFGDHISALNPAAVAIEGGVRVRDFTVRWAMPMPKVIAAGGPAVNPAIEPNGAARTWLASKVAGTSDAAQWLVIRVEQPGDHSLYTLRLAQSGGVVLDGFDRRLCSVDFSFKVQCPSSADCAAEQTCSPQAVAAPELDYLARDFGSFRRLLFDRLALLQPGEDQRDPALLRSTLVELLAWGADRVAYQQDAVATEAYLGTARLRRSVRRHARLLDYVMHEGCNARAFVHLTLQAETATGSAAAPAVPIAARFCTRIPELVRPSDQVPWPFLGPAQVQALTSVPVIFECLRPLVRASAAHNEVQIWSWGDQACCLPRGLTSLTLADPMGALELAVGDFLLLEEVSTGHVASDATLSDPDPNHRQVVRLTAVSPRYRDVLLDMDLVDVTWHVDDALHFDLPLAATDGKTTVARANMVLVDHGQRARDEDLEVLSFGRQSRYARLQGQGLTWSQPLPSEGATGLFSVTRLLSQDPRQAIAQLTLWEQPPSEGDNFERWLPRRDLLSSSGSSQDFVVEMEDDQRAYLRFGDDELGRAPAIGLRFAQADYRIGNGTLGNVGAQAIVHAMANPDDVLAFPLETAGVLDAVRNPLPASGGQAAESIDEVKLYAPHAFVRQERAVTVQDWSEVAQRDPEIQRAIATIRWTGSWSTVYLHLDRREGRPVDADFREKQLARLATYRLAGYDLEIVGPSFVAVELVATVCVQSGFLRDDVERRLRREFTTGLLPDGRRGFFHPDEFTFGQPLHLSRVIARMMAVAGVAEVNFTPPKAVGEPPHAFKRWGHPQGDEVERGRISVGRLEIIRCDNDPNFPDNGRISFLLGGGI